MKDVRKLEQKDYSSFSKRLVEEKTKIKTFLNEQYKDITKNQAKICNI